MRRTLCFALLAVVVATSCSVVRLHSAPHAVMPAQEVPLSLLTLEEQKHLKNVHQLTFGGQNAEAYFSADGRQLIFQSTHGDVKCDQIFTMNIDGSNVKMVSTGKGRTTCSYFYPDGRKILYSSTHLADEQCPPRPDYSKGYA